ncbi:superoxide dismutase [Risungbinella massiliensis]|uniref:superoxide dismutase n=1 Tax=Risungbinella massiliensis TaxID=1329796 RepID=UPI00069A1E7F|nr:superoxide dismutase [Risungbinella massiliensis]
MQYDWLDWMKKPLNDMLQDCQQQAEFFPQEEQQEILGRFRALTRSIKYAIQPATYYQAWEELIALQRYCRERRELLTLSIQDTEDSEVEPSAIEKDSTAISVAPYRPVPIGQHKLPPLRYSYDALEPYIDRETMRIHHAELHQKYVNDLNKAEKQLQNAREKRNYDLVKHWERELAFNGAGHYLHTIFFDIMSPGAGGEPKGDLRDQIIRDFGSYRAFKEHFSQAAEKVEGGGWALLIWSPRAQRLEILQAEKHQNLSQQDQIPILALDVWEHAYYLKYPNKRKAYIENWFKVVDWNRVNDRYDTARRVLWQPY